MKGGELNCKAQHTNTVRTMGVRVHTDLLCLRHGGQLMELESDSWGVFGWCRCQSKLKTRSVAKNSRERVGKRKLWCAQNWDLPMGAFGGVYPVVDGATTGLCMPVQSYGSTSCALDSAVKAQYEGQGERSGYSLLPSSTIGRAMCRSGFVVALALALGFGFTVVLTHIFYAPAARQAAPQADRSFHLSNLHRHLYVCTHSSLLC